jgi:hypothetical protein
VAALEPLESMHVLELLAVVNDPFDGAVRILLDAQRFGFKLKELHLEHGNDGASTITLRLLVPAGSDAGHIRSRLARHAAVASLEPDTTGVC